MFESTGYGWFCFGMIIDRDTGAADSVVKT